VPKSAYTLPVTTPAYNRDKLDVVVERQMDFFEGSNVDSWIERCMLRNLVKEDLQTARNRRKFDAFAGSRLVRDGRCMLFPSGANMSRLGKVYIMVVVKDFDHYMNHLPTLSADERSLQLKTPILQITVCKARTNTPSVYIIRSMEGIHVVSSSGESNNLETLEEFNFDQEPVHVAASSVIPNHTAFVLKRGQGSLV
jgi:hypothetical protein